MQVFEAIAHPDRRRILDLLKRGPLSAGELARHFDFSWPALSQHLKILLKARLVTQSRQWKHRIYTLEAAPLIEECANWIRSYEIFWRGKLQVLKQHVESSWKKERKLKKKKF